MKRRALSVSRLLALGLVLVAAVPGCGAGDTGLGSPVRFRFAVMGDTRGDFQNFELVDVQHFPTLVTAVAALQPTAEFLLFTGDAGLLGTSLEWDQWMSTMEPILSERTVLYPTLGNHEFLLSINQEKRIEGFKTRFDLPKNGPPGYEGLTFSVDHDNVHVVNLTSNLGGGEAVDDVQIDWLAADLAASTKPLKVVLFHEPAYPTGAHLGSSLDTNLTQRDKLWAVIDAAQVDVVFNGHEHNYSRWTIDSRVDSRWKHKVVQVVSGGGGAPLSDELKVEGPEVFVAAFQYVVVDVHADAMDVHAIDESGQEIDRFSAS